MKNLIALVLVLSFTTTALAERGSGRDPIKEGSHENKIIVNSDHARIDP
jgi:predicted small secreted protein